MRPQLSFEKVLATGKAFIFMENMRKTSELAFEWKRSRLAVRKTFLPQAAKQIRGTVFSALGDSSSQNVPLGPRGCRALGRPFKDGQP